MQYEEILLSNYNMIYTLLNAGFDIKAMVGEVNKCLQLNITYWQLVHLIRKVRNNTIHKEYDHVVVIDNLKDAWILPVKQDNKIARHIKLVC